MGAPPDRTPLEEFAAGLAEGTIKALGPKVKDLASLLFNRKLAFIGRRDYVREVKEQSQSAEWQFFKDFITDERLSILALMGLTLRDWESDPGRRQDIENLRNRIFRKFGQEGVHIAQVVQSRILSRIIAVAVDSSPTSKRDAARLIETFLNSAFLLCRFVQNDDSSDELATQIRNHLTLQKPPLFVLFARGKAIKICDHAVKRIIATTPGYAPQIDDLYGSRIVMLVRNDIGSGRPTD